MQQTLELATEPFHSLLTHDYNADGISEVLLARLVKNGTNISIIHPKQLANLVVRINEPINIMSVAQTSLDRSFELITGDHKGVIRINSRNGKPFFSRDIKDGIRLPSSIFTIAPGDLNGNKLHEIIVGCQNGEIVMVERIPGKKMKWDKIRGFSLGKIFGKEVRHIITGDYNGNGTTGFIAGSQEGLFKEIEFRPQLQKFDLIGEFRIETPPTCCFSGDIDRDGISEVMIGEQNGRLSIFKKNRLMSTHNLDSAITCGAVGDVDNDRQLEVVVGTDKGSFHILRSNTIENYEGYSNISDLKIGDLNGNRQNDLVFSIDKRRILAFSFTRDKMKEKPNADLLPFPGKQGQTQDANATAQIPDVTDVFCPNCESQVRFIEQYRRWYCNSCRQYIAPVSKQEAKPKIRPMIEAQSHGSPYDPYSVQGAYAPQTQPDIEKVKSKVEGAISISGEEAKNIEWKENKEEIEVPDVDANYFLPLDLESDLETGAKFFNDILKIKHVILIHSHSGVPLYSQSFGKQIDVSLTSGFLSAVGTFTEEMSGDTEKRVGIFSEIGREGFWILIYEAESAKAALLVSEKLGPELKKRITYFMKEFEKEYYEQITNFNGFVSAFSGAADLLEKHLRLEYLYPLKIDAKRMRLTAITSDEKKLAKAYTEFLQNRDDEVFYLTELLEVVLDEHGGNMDLPSVLKVLIKYLENGMLIPLPPPPEDMM
ncbi:MAG: FG-GAP repeat domain-containing protein [Candidatus Heimdallarchaeota archaeon]